MGDWGKLPVGTLMLKIQILMTGLAGYCMAATYSQYMATISLTRRSGYHGNKRRYCSGFTAVCANIPQ
ncbi:hypothetical protein XELAEV_18012746mg [Xenopus laevis]|uniref:Uncharacterized protein n=1 Tax=Xenopus laevis TaxID=8355 RepID=A0A974DN88_XENLA|nr:hypothetical protein XELAEV_18012746mg [Xenopus laevis]